MDSNNEIFWQRLLDLLYLLLISLTYSLLRRRRRRLKREAEERSRLCAVSRCSPTSSDVGTSELGLDIRASTAAAAGAAAIAFAAVATNSQPVGLSPDIGKHVMMASGGGSGLVKQSFEKCLANRRGAKKLKLDICGMSLSTRNNEVPRGHGRKEREREAAAKSAAASPAIRPVQISDGTASCNGLEASNSNDNDSSQHQRSIRSIVSARSEENGELFSGCILLGTFLLIFIGYLVGNAAATCPACPACPSNEAIEAAAAAIGTDATAGERENARTLCSRTVRAQLVSCSGFVSPSLVKMFCNEGTNDYGSGGGQEPSESGEHGSADGEDGGGGMGGENPPTIPPPTPPPMPPPPSSPPPQRSPAYPPPQLPPPPFAEQRNTSRH